MPSSLFLTVLGLLPLAVIVRPSWLSLIVLTAVFALQLFTRFVARTEGYAKGHTAGFDAGHDRALNPKFINRALD